MAANQQARQKAILKALLAGNTQKAACKAARTPLSTFYHWLEIDGSFRESVEKAEADAELECVEIIRGAAKAGTWQAAAWWLERSRHEDWKKRDELDLRRLTTEQLVELYRATRSGAVAPGSAAPRTPDREPGLVG